MNIEAPSTLSAIRVGAQEESHSREIPELGGGLPVLGLALEFQKNPLAVLERGYKEHGPVFQFKLAGQDFVLFAGPKAHEAYFRAADDHLSARDVYQFTVPIFGKGVAYDAPPEIMNEQLGFLRPALSERRMETYARLMAEETEAYVRSWGEEGEIDLARVTHELTINIATRCLLGPEIRERLNDGFAEHYHDLQGGMNTLGFFMPRLPTRAHRRRDRARREVAKLIGSALAVRRERGNREEDFMQSLIDARYASGRSLSDDEIIGILLTTLFGSQHASAVLGAWVGIELVQNPDYLDRVHTEIAELSGSDRLRGWSMSKQQVVLERAIQECERLHPPLIMLIRKVTRPYEYDGYVVPEGTLAMVSPALSHRLREVFTDPHRFDPDRFVPHRDELGQSPYALIGFGGGRHRCMGLHFAYLQLKAIWTRLLSDFDFELASPAPAPDYGNWVVGPARPCTMRYRRRFT